jgi:hypothetical protein
LGRGSGTAAAGFGGFSGLPTIGGLDGFTVLPNRIILPTFGTIPVLHGVYATAAGNPLEPGKANAAAGWGNVAVLVGLGLIVSFGSYMVATWAGDRRRKLRRLSGGA